MALRIVRLGSPRAPEEGLRIGTVRRPPRGVPKAERGERDFFDVWYPNLAPSEALLAASKPHDATSWKVFRRRFSTELDTPDKRRELELLAALSHHTNVSIGCYCADESRCHRSILREKLAKLGALIVD